MPQINMPPAPKMTASGMLKPRAMSPPPMKVVTGGPRGMGMSPMKSCMPPGGTLSPRGDLGALRQAEAKKAIPRNFKGLDSGTPNELKGMKPPRIMGGDAIVVGALKGGDRTVGGVVGGLHDKGDYQGITAGGKRR